MNIKIYKNNIIKIFLMFYCLSVLSFIVSCESKENVLDPVEYIVLDPGQSKEYIFKTSDPLKMGIGLPEDNLLDLNETNVVKLQEKGTVSCLSITAGYASTVWLPKDGTVCLIAKNESSKRIKVVIYRGDFVCKGKNPCISMEINSNKIEIKKKYKNSQKLIKPVGK